MNVFNNSICFDFTATVLFHPKRQPPYTITWNDAASIHFPLQQPQHHQYNQQIHFNVVNGRVCHDQVIIKHKQIDK